MLLLNLALPTNWVLYDKPFGFNVWETTTMPRSETTRVGDVRIRIFSRDREGWNNLEAVTTWNDARKSKETVWFRQSRSTGEIQCVSVKGTERAHTFNPPLVMWSGENSATVQMTPTFRPFGRHSVKDGKSQGYDAPPMEWVTTKRPAAEYAKLSGVVDWKHADPYSPLTYRLTGEFETALDQASESGFSGRESKIIYRIRKGVETMWERAPAGDRKLWTITYTTS